MGELEQRQIPIGSPLHLRWQKLMEDYSAFVADAVEAGYVPYNDLDVQMSVPITYESTGARAQVLVTVHHHIVQLLETDTEDLLRGVQWTAEQLASIGSKKP